MRARASSLLVLLPLALAFAMPALADFTEDFSDNSAGWSTGPEWQIGPTFPGPAPGSGSPDPAQDHSPSSDNGVAGMVLGGNISTSLHAPYYLTSPPVDVTGVPGTVQLRFWRWLNSDYPPYMQATVDVFDGSTWITLYASQSGTPVFDDAWTQLVYDVTAYKNANFRVRFGLGVGSGGAYVVSGWNVDDVEIGGVCTGDEDGDGHPAIACGGDDCDDENPAVHPGAAEVCDGLDNDCSGQIDDGLTFGYYYPDADGDGYGSYYGAIYACSTTVGYISESGDCDDGNPAIHPGVAEVCDGLDNNCDGQIDEGVSTTYYPDYDGDGYGSSGGSPVCPGVPPPDGWVTVTGDCNDYDPDIHPGATERCNNLDDDCDAVADETCLYNTITAIRDVAGDQGRNVRISWFRAQGDVPGGYATSYTLWRRIAPGLAPSSAREAHALSARPNPAEIDALPPGSWDFLTSVPAMNEDTYNFVAPTLCDSNAAGVCWSVFLLRAHYGSSYVDAPLDSGYSVDNLVPPPPAAASKQNTTGGAQLAWSANPAPDFQTFRVYRGTAAGFTPGPGNLVHATSGTAWTDPAGLAAHVYKVTALDFNGNESAPTTATSTVGVESSAPLVTGLRAIAPNPSPGAMRIGFDLAAAGPVALDVIDVAGRRVRRIASGRWEPGRHELAWDGRDSGGARVAPGVYLVRFVAGGRSEVRRVAIAR